MDWLKDKKNQPIVAAILAVVILGAAAAMYFLYFKGDSAPVPSDQGTETTFDPNAPQPTADGTTPTPGTEMGQPTPDATGAAATTTQPAANTGQATASATPMEPWRADPFLPPGYKPDSGKGAPKIKPHIPLPPVKIPIPGIDTKPPPKPDLPQPVRRMAGLILGDKVYAIIEAGGKNQVVQPGDRLEDGLASVFKIEKDRVILKTADEKPRYLVVRMSQGVRTVDASSGQPMSPMPNRPRRPGGFPGGPGEGLPGPEPM